MTLTHHVFFLVYFIFVFHFLGEDCLVVSPLVLAHTVDEEHAVQLPQHRSSNFLVHLVAPVDEETQVGKQDHHKEEGFHGIGHIHYNIIYWLVS